MKSAFTTVSLVIAIWSVFSDSAERVTPRSAHNLEIAGANAYVVTSGRVLAHNSSSSGEAAPLDQRVNVLVQTTRAAMQREDLRATIKELLDRLRHDEVPPAENFRLVLSGIREAVGSGTNSLQSALDSADQALEAYEGRHRSPTTTASEPSTTNPPADLSTALESIDRALERGLRLAQEELRKQTANVLRGLRSSIENWETLEETERIKRRREIDAIDEWLPDLRTLDASRASPLVQAIQWIRQTPPVLMEFAMAKEHLRLTSEDIYLMRAVRRLEGLAQDLQRTEDWVLGRRTSAPDP